jgi:hypothetical protein
MLKEFQTIYSRIIGTQPLEKGFCGIDISSQFLPDKNYPEDIGRNLNAAFLIALCGNTHPRSGEAFKYLRSLEKDTTWGEIARFYYGGIGLLDQETGAAVQSDDDLRNQLDMTYHFVMGHRNADLTPDLRRNLWSLFFPEGVFSEGNRQERIAQIRDQREVKILHANPNPVTDPAREIIFTSNVLLTLPENPESLDALPFSADLIEKLKSAVTEEQAFWYDHPIQIGVPPDRNQAICGLRGLNEMMAFEKARGTAAQDSKLTCILSVSVTHTGLHAIARKYLEEELQKIEPLPHLKVIIFSEVEARRLIEEILYPAAVKYLDIIDIGILTDVIGVDGEYGRHYSFLKAVAALWQVFMDHNVKGTFKIDLDQVFPQAELVKETGASAFDHFKTPLWGAEGKDKSGDDVELGMIAGGLVTQEDIKISLFTPNIKYPPEVKGGEGLFFYSRLPMALSTEAEICTRYPLGHIDGKSACLQRVHVIGGVNGILVSALRKYRPFSPSFIGRAEDQAYLLTVLFKQVKADLRYAHKDGLIMRQDIRAISAAALKAGEVGRQIGDLVRILVFTYYTRALTWPLGETKAYLEPFTGCFISKLPFTIVFSRLAMSIAELFASSDPLKNAKACEVQRQGTIRLSKAMSYLNQTPNPLIERLEKERKAWNLYYDVLAGIEDNLKSQDYFALKLQRRAENFLNECGVNIGR